MKPQEYKEIMTALSQMLGFSNQKLVRLFGYKSHATAYQWESGKTRIPQEVADFLRQLHHKMQTVFADANFNIEIQS